MNIIHIAPNATYAEGWSYQENLLTKYQAKLGHNVTLIVPNTTWVDGKKVETACCDYVSKDGFRVIRLDKRNIFCNSISKYYYYLDVYKYLLDINPDIVFFHGFINITIFQVTKYKRKINKSLKIIQDNHLDYNIGKIKWTPLGLLSFIKNRLYFKINKKYIDKIYGVTPWRKQYAIEIYGVPEKKSDVLIMGADDEKIDFKNRNNIRLEIRKKYNIPQDAFLVVSGGKIDKKKNIHILINAVSKTQDIYLLFFGTMEKDIEEYIYKTILEHKNIIFAHWIPSDKIYNYFFAADLICFPGQHSVLWEQACASKVPCVFKRWVGMEHLDIGGNVSFVDEVNAQNLLTTLNSLKFTDEYFKMKSISQTSKTDIFLYSNIAKKSLDL